MFFDNAEDKSIILINNGEELDDIIDDLDSNPYLFEEM